jgi:hypothetical protein
VKISELLARVQALPQPITFDWPGVEQWHDEVFVRDIQSQDQAMAYIALLKDRVREQSHAICQLRDAYNALINWIRELEVD